jgi:hypothetical protein
MELARMRKLAGLTESFEAGDDGDGLDGVDAVSVAADAAAASGKPAPTAEEIADHVAAFMAAFQTLKDNNAFTPEIMAAISESESLDEGIEQKIKKSMKTLCTAAMWLGLYNLGGPILDATGLPFPDLSHISYDLLGMVSPDSGVEQGYIGSQY